MVCDIYREIQCYTHPTNSATKNNRFIPYTTHMSIAVITSLLPVVLKGVVSLVERIKGNGKGPEEKKPLAVDIIKTLFASLQAPGVGLPKDDKEIGVLVESTVAELNAAGKLKGYATVVDSDIDAPLLELCAVLLEGQARRLRVMAGK